MHLIDKGKVYARTNLLAQELRNVKEQKIPSRSLTLTEIYITD